MENLQLHLEGDVLFAVLDDSVKLSEAIKFLIKRMDSGIWVVISAVGMLKQTEIGVFSLEKGEYQKRSFNEPLEVLHISGSVNPCDELLLYHFHVILGMSNFNVVGGHLFDAYVHNTLEICFLRTGAFGKRIKDGTRIILRLK